MTKKLRGFKIVLKPLRFVLCYYNFQYCKFHNFRPLLLYVWCLFHTSFHNCCKGKEKQEVQEESAVRLSEYFSLSRVASIICLGFEDCFRVSLQKIRYMTYPD